VRPKIKPFRLGLILFIFLLGLVAFLAKLTTFQMFRASLLTRLAAKQHSYYVELEPQRGAILDRDLQPLAVNVTTYSLYVVPMDVKDKERVIVVLGEILGLDRSFLEERLNRKKHFVWIARKLDWDKRERIRAQKLAGLGFLKETKRSYPHGSMAAQLLGFAGTDNTGLDGLEMTADATLKGTPGWTTVMRDARQHVVSLDAVLQPATDGHSLVLTIDQVVQYIVEREIENIFTKYHAKGATIVVLDVKTGEILAVANRPTYDLNNFKGQPMEARRDRCVTDYFEPGSVFKIVTASAGLDTGVFSPDDKIFCENGEYRVANHTLHDVHPYGTLAFREVIAQSSNIGTTKIAQKIGGEVVYKYAALFGFGRSTGSGLPGEVGGVLKPVSRWSKTSIGAVPIGQEVCVTTMQLAAAIAAIANGGVLMKPYVVSAVIDNKGEIIKSFAPEEKGRVISVATAAKMREILAGVVATGTGKLAASTFYRFGGKTGTGQKIDPNGTYSHSKFMASFIGFAPVEDPEIAIAVVVDEPRPYYYGGVVSAPAFKAIAEDILKVRQLKVVPVESPAEAPGGVS
jgi:cell division protein FtsI (penicillin-binding protein 3)